MPTITVCPYTLKPLNQLKSSIEHIIPFALGGPDSFFVEADEITNNSLGLTVDSGLINDHIAKGLAAHFDLTTRSGPAKLKVPGKANLNNSEIPISILIEHQKISVSSSKPVMQNESGYLLIGTESEIAKHLRKIYSSGEKKGVTLTAGKITTGPATGGFKLKHNSFKKTCGLLKIGYLSLVYIFGDQFINSAAAIQFRSGFNAQTEAELNNTNILNDFISDSAINLNQDGMHEIIVVRGHGAYCVFVSLFHDKTFTRQFSVLDPEVDTNDDFQGMIFIIEPRRRTLQSETPVTVGDLVTKNDKSI